ncbi:MAG: LVIVD repeat-containing protein [Actinomycetota bacterium]
MHPLGIRIPKESSIKRFLILALVLSLSLALLGPAAAGKKKKKGPKPYKSEEVSIEVGHPVFHSASGGNIIAVTAQEFFASCSIPSSNGFDGYVFEVPADLQKYSAAVEATGTSVTDAASPADMDMYFYDDACELTGAANTAGTDEVGAILPGTAFIFLHNYTGGPTTASITITPVAAATRAAPQKVKVVSNIPYSGGTDIDFAGDRVFFTESAAVTNGTVRIVKASGKKPELLGEFTCGGNQNDVAAIDENTIALGSHWGTCGPQPGSGVNLLDVTDPTNPSHLGFVPLPYGVHTLTKHPKEPLIYTSASFNELPTVIIDVSDPAAPVTTPTTLQGCHDISFYLTKSEQLAFCAAGSVETEIWDVSDPMDPQVVSSIVDDGIGYHHLAVATPDGRYLVIGDEDSGGTCSGNQTSREFGAISIYDITDRAKPKMVGFMNAPRGPWVCWAHNFNFVPGTRKLVIGWWEAGTSVIDLSNPTKPREIAAFQPDTAYVWSSYWYEGRIYVNSGTGAWVIEIPGLKAGR